jgi:UDP-galactopyranose mutase
MFDYLVIGAGFAGCVLAERLAAGLGKLVLLVDKRPHIGGNAYDHYDEHGVLVHRYGPHIFHTNSAEVFRYLSRFTEWFPYQHRVRAWVDGRLVPIPINLDTINELYGTKFNAFQLAEFYKSVAEPRAELKTSEDVILNQVGRELYEKFFRSWMRRSPRACRPEPIATIAISPTPTRRCRCGDSRACSNGCSTIRTSRSS